VIRLIYAISNWVFDLLYLIGTILTVWPIVFINRNRAKNINTVGWIAERDTKEIIPQVKWSWTGIILLALSVIFKFAFILISSTIELSNQRLVISILIIICCIVILTAVIRLTLINKYWK